jgi:hypothetical protein
MKVMLFELHIKYKDGRTERPIVHADKGGEVKIHPQRDNIVAAGCKRFRYRVVKHSTLPITIVKFGEKTLIYPAKIECHPKTTLEDVVEVKSKKQLQIIKPKITPIVEFKTWKFESASGGGTYVVRETAKGLKCDCPGTWRAKDRRCKHIKEMEVKLGLLK